MGKGLPKWMRAVTVRRLCARRAVLAWSYNFRKGVRFMGSLLDMRYP